MADIIKENYDPQEQSVEASLTELFKRALDAHSAETRVCCPAEVISYDFKKQMVSVKPFFQRKYRDGTIDDAPIIYNVPLAIQRSGDAFISMPVEKGHSVLLVFADRSLDKWLSSGKQGTPDDARKHSMSDAIAIPGCYPFSNSAPVQNGSDVIVKNKDLEMRLKKNGHVEIFNGQYELMTVLKEWMDASIAGSHHRKKRIRTKFLTFVEK